MCKTNSRYFIFDVPTEPGIKNVIKTGIAVLKSIIYKAILFTANPNIKEKKYKVSVCAIFKNEAPYIREWLEFNHLVGIEHFYLYNNNSEDDYLKVLQPYIDAGMVTLVQWPHNQKQMASYQDCIKKYSCETNWLGFIDIDEFIVPKSTDNIYDFLKTFERKAGAVNIYWRLFGTSGFLDRDLDGLVSEDLTVCWPKYCDIGKCFYNTAFKFDPDSKKNINLHHKFWANHKGIDIPPVNIFNHICVCNRNIADSFDFPIQINHYFTKSYKEYAKKKEKGDVYFTINPHDEMYFYEHEMKCTSTDYSAYKYIVKLKLKFGRKV
ncbi:glycosyltransferase family 92 protein [Succinivibrio faecicola]|uniref:Glycosyltransferase family 92 protein n=1 Tax=Succinivibrio faecicola TaxID=2820300 RepID=A0ABS7DIF4_9GAMM|nr:glycosyltransferase family 92 protein [Succinivibrio faecicola]MBW7571087.1 glycosyltransferase family 92 protein [Succinivibrio faecicola]